MCCSRSWTRRGQAGRPGMLHSRDPRPARRPEPRAGPQGDRVGGVGIERLGLPSSSTTTCTPGVVEPVQDRSVARTIQAVAVAPPRNPGMGTDHGPYSTARSAIVAGPGRHREESGRLRLQARDPPPRGGIQADQAFHVWHVGAGRNATSCSAKSPPLYRVSWHRPSASRFRTPGRPWRNPRSGTLMEVQSGPPVCRQSRHPALDPDR